MTRSRHLQGNARRRVSGRRFAPVTEIPPPHAATRLRRAAQRLPAGSGTRRKRQRARLKKRRPRGPVFLAA
jgi:hypothetical protein